MEFYNQNIGVKQDLQNNSHKIALPRFHQTLNKATKRLEYRSLGKCLCIFFCIGNTKQNMKFQFKKIDTPRYFQETYAFYASIQDNSRHKLFNANSVLVNIQWY